MKDNRFLFIKPWFCYLVLTLFFVKPVLSQSLVVKIDYPFNRQDMLNLADGGNTDFSQRIFLKNQYQVISFIAQNTSSTNINVKINVDLKSNWNADLREASPLGTWYSKGKSKVYDPLILSKKEGASWNSVIPKNGYKKFLLIFKVPNDEQNGTYNLPVNIVNTGSNEQTKATIKYTILPNPQPISRNFTHIAFTNTYNNVNFTSMVSDLSRNYVNLLEFPVMPNVTFQANGQIAASNWQSVDRYLSVLKDYPNIKLLIFWQPYYNKMKINSGQNLTYMSKEWLFAFGNLLEAFLSHAKDRSIPANRFQILIMDEIHSKSTSSVVDPSIQECIQIAKYLKAEFPNLNQSYTFSNNTQFKDVQSVFDYSGTFIQHWPLPRKSTSLGAKLDPSMEFKTKTKSIMSAFRNKGNVVLNYHISKGKSDEIMADDYLFPVFSLLNGNTGIGWWAYNSFSGSSWIDTDGGKLDYSFIYNGNDNKGTNLLSGRPQEDIVPSLRWIAARSGVQNAMIFQTIKASQNKLSKDQADQFRVIENGYRGLLDEFGNPIKMSNVEMIKKVFSLDNKLLMLWGKLGN